MKAKYGGLDGNEDADVFDTHAPAEGGIHGAGIEFAVAEFGDDYSFGYTGLL